MRTLKVVEVHKFEECEKVNFNSMWVFKGDGQHSGDELFDNDVWVFFYFANGQLELQIDSMDTRNIDNKTICMMEGIKSFISKQISIRPVNK